MGTKNQPGKFDCYASAAPDEPMFVLLGRDPVARFVVEEWVRLRIGIGKDAPNGDRVHEALACAAALQRWAENQGKCHNIAWARDTSLRLRMMRSTRAVVLKAEWRALDEDKRKRVYDLVEKLGGVSSNKTEARAFGVAVALLVEAELGEP